jgi:hypothetical protein
MKLEIAATIEVKREGKNNKIFRKKIKQAKFLESCLFLS